MKFVTLGVMAVIIALGIGVAMAFMRTSNTEVSLRAQVAAQQQSNEAVFDNTWKILSQQAQLTEAHKEAFKSIYVGLMEGRYNSGTGKGSLMVWIKEQNPVYDQSNYSRLMNSIEVQRTNFTREQQKLIDLKREHDVLLTTYPSQWFVGSRPKIDIVIVTSSRTGEAFREGKDDQVDLYPTAAAPPATAPGPASPVTAKQ
jgi:hypothetical protein